MQNTKLPNAVMAAVGMSLFYALIYASSAWPAASTKSVADHRNFNAPSTSVPSVPSVSQDSDSFLLAQGRSLCNSNEAVFFTGQTTNFRVYICGRDRPNYYVGVEKSRPTNLIRLPLKDYGEEYFEAVNGEYTYIVSNTPRGRFLTVSQGYRELVREAISRY
jgi:hypothetical protein